ncbi:hypothetical protein CF386_08705 [Paraphotobacterium marinum]|uniref:SET domain-containing protein n=1 Tax=Paraphotobacterium marinum TaxID=1755811 RepID=A0A220VFL9_9GAMM|nr:SET domain-containing protein-lysine N-methyltransferase [Paraphotobacterium marinum]ASK79139.1 hypothetical protein CF386_08705 [Paraphotobacterium marinum]
MVLNTNNVMIGNIKYGEGLIATKNIKKGDVVLVEKCNVFTILQYKDFMDPACDSCFLVRAIVTDNKNKVNFDSFNLKSNQSNSYVPSKDDMRFLKKLSKRTGKPLNKLIEIWEIVCAHHIKVILLQYNEVKKIRLQLSKYINKGNHSCDPNTIVKSHLNSSEDFNSKTVKLIASKDINEGDEITFSYIDEHFSNYDFNTRQQTLQSSCGFSCQCSKCESEVLCL